MSERKESTKDVEAREAFEGAGATYDFFDKIFWRKSIDGRGMRLVSTIHYERNFNNAMWDGYVFTADDNGGVHINSGILNHAFFLTATRLGGHSWDVAGWLWYVVLEERLSPKATFQDFANATVLLAGQKFGFGGHVQTTVADAWAEVGLQVPLSLIKGGAGISTLAVY